MKRTLLAIGLTVAFLVAGATPAIGAAPEYPKGLKILNFYDNSFEPSAEGFKANWTQAGNSYTNVTTYNFANLGADGYNILLLPRTMNLTSTDLSNIQTWFATGDKLLWVGGDSDYAGLYLADNTANPLLTKIGTALRMSSISVEDPASNDEAAYRVVANETGVSSPLTDYVTNGFNRMVFHGPAAVHYAMDGTAYDLRNATLGSGALANVNIVVNASSHAIAKDSDLTIAEADFYAYSNTTGHYPMLVTDQIDNSMVVVSAESVFTDYKNMYGHNDENGGDAHQGGMVVDNLISYYYNQIVKWTPPATTSSGTTPFNAFFAFLSISVVAIFTYRRRQ